MLATPGLDLGSNRAKPMQDEMGRDVINTQSLTPLLLCYY